MTRTQMIANALIGFGVIIVSSTVSAWWQAALLDAAAFMVLLPVARQIAAKRSWTPEARKARREGR